MGPGGLERATKRLSAPAGKFQIRRAHPEIGSPRAYGPRNWKSYCGYRFNYRTSAFRKTRPSKMVAERAGILLQRNCAWAMAFILLQQTGWPSSLLKNLAIASVS